MAQVESVKVFVSNTWDEGEAIAKAKGVLLGTGLKLDRTERPERAYKEWIVIFTLPRHK